MCVKRRVLNMSTQIVKIKGELAKLNEHDAANRNNKFGGAKLKKDMTDLVMYQLGSMKQINKPIHLVFTWYFSGKHDLDNVAFSKKYVLDSFVKSGKLPNDNQKWVHGFTDTFKKVKKGEDGVMVIISECEEKEPCF